MFLVLLLTELPVDSVKVFNELLNLLRFAYLGPKALLREINLIEDWVGDKVFYRILKIFLTVIVRKTLYIIDTSLKFFRKLAVSLEGTTNIYGLVRASREERVLNLRTLVGEFGKGIIN